MTARGAALLVVGTTSGAGKSTLTSALCRALARRDVDVAPFKAQNMSNHSAVTPDGGEIGRAQAMQALAARVETDRRMGPVLLKPSGARTSHLVVLGEEVGVADAVGYGERATRLRPVVLEALQSLRVEHEVVVLEGAGGAAEINLLERDLVNLPLAAAAGLPAVLVVDIERGGAFAAAYGTWALLPERLRACLRGFVVNSFRGDVSLLEPGLRDLETRTGVPVLGVLPHLGEHLMLGVEDSLDLGAHLPSVAADGSATGQGVSARPVRVAVVRLPHLANPSDLDPLVLEPDVELRWATAPGDLADADLVILPGSRATVADLAWLRERGLDKALAACVADPRGAHVLGICAGYQMLGEVVHDEVESGAGTVPGLGLLPVVTTFATPKTVRRSLGVVVGGEDRGGGGVVAGGMDGGVMPGGEDGGVVVGGKDGGVMPDSAMHVQNSCDTSNARAMLVSQLSGTSIDEGRAIPVHGYEIRWGRPELTSAQDTGPAGDETGPAGDETGPAGDETGLAGDPSARATVWLRLVGAEAGGDAEAEGKGGVEGEGEGDAEGDAEGQREDGCISADARVRGTSLHGILDSDALRHSLIQEVATARERDFTPSGTPYAVALDAHVDHLADWVEAHLDIPGLLALARAATPVAEAPGW